jgi:hypothetical protein
MRWLSKYRVPYIRAKAFTMRQDNSSVRPIRGDITRWRVELYQKCFVPKCFVIRPNNHLPPPPTSNTTLCRQPLWKPGGFLAWEIQITTNKFNVLSPGYMGVFPSSNMVLVWRFIRTASMHTCMPPIRILFSSVRTTPMLQLSCFGNYMPTS